MALPEFGDVANQMRDTMDSLAAHFDARGALEALAPRQQTFASGLFAPQSGSYASGLFGPSPTSFASGLFGLQDNQGNFATGLFSALPDTGLQALGSLPTSQWGGKPTSPVANLPNNSFGVANGEWDARGVGTPSEIKLTTKQAASAYIGLFNSVSKESGVPADVLAAIAELETGGSFDPNSTSPDNPGHGTAKGLMQLLDSTARQYGVSNPYDPEQSVRGAARYLKALYQQYGSWDLAAAAYFGAIDSQGHITSARDVGGMTGLQYVQMFNEARGHYQATPLPTTGGLPVATANPSGDRPSQDPNKAKVFAFAQAETGKRYAGPVIGEPESYRWGSPGWDCSSFVSAAFKQMGVDLTPYTDTMFQQTSAVAGEPQPGDLVFWSGYDDGQAATYKHVAIYLGNGQIIDASYGTGVSQRALTSVVKAPGARITFRRVQP